jgi:hypothetical protein
MTNTTQALLAKSLVTAKEILKQFATQSDFLDQLELAFGDDFDSNIALGIAASIKADDFSQILATPVSAINNFAFDSGDDQSLINDEVLPQNSSRQQLIVNLLLQEVGRKFDVLLNGTVDSSGDEGRIFAAIAQGEAPSAQSPVAEIVVSELQAQRPAQMIAAIWYNPELDANTQDTIAYDESYIATDADLVFDNVVIDIDGGQTLQILPAIWYNPDLDSNTQDPVAYDESYIATDLVFDNVVIDIDGGQTLQIFPAIWYNPDLDSNTQDTIVYEESYTTIEYGNPIVDSVVSEIEGEQPIVIGKPFYYDPEADISSDDTIPDGDYYVSIDDGNSIVDSQQLFVGDDVPKFITTEYIVTTDESFTDSIKDSNQGIQTKRVMQGSNNEGIDVPEFDNSDISLTNEDINFDPNLFCVLPVFDIEYIVDESAYTGGNTFIFGGEDLAMNTTQALLLATPITLEFTTGLDKLLLNQSTFNSIYTNVDGGISSFANVADDSLVDLNDAEIVYSQSTGKLFYNQNGGKIGLGDGGGQFATLSGSSALSAGDFGILSDLSAY